MTKALQIRFDQHLRFDEDWTRLQKVMPELSVRLKLGKHVRLGSGYRFKYERSGSGDFKNEHRLHGDATFRIKLAALRLDHRVRFQETFDDGEYRHTLRNRLRLGLAFWKEVRPFVAAELFNPFGDDQGFRVGKWRFTAGSSLELGDHSLDVFYRCELPQDSFDEPRLHIIGLGYHYDLPLPRL